MRSRACRTGRTGSSSALANAAIDPSDYFRLPTNRVVELGSHVII
jgi:K+ transporter